MTSTTAPDWPRLLIRLAIACSASVVVAAMLRGQSPRSSEEPAMQTPVLRVNSCDDFEVNGKGDAKQWEQADWEPLQHRPKGKLNYEARFKMLYSPTGLYVLFDGTDARLTATMTEDFADLWNEDVFECFFWPDETHPVYFEYEISPLGYELPILVPQIEGKILGWRPWHYEGKRKIKKAVSIAGGEQKSGAKIDGWRAEVFIPYELLSPLANVPPKPGTTWRANFYRCDYDDNQASSWDWARVGNSFHEIKKFGTLVFQ